MKMFSKLLFGSLMVGVAYFGWKLTSRSAYEAAAYEVIEQEGAFEVRSYPELVLATTSTSFATQGNDGSFMRLFQYISGENADNKRIAMTVPVFMSSDDSPTEEEMGFVIPTSVAEGKVPAPTDKQVSVRKRDAGLYAVIRFAGLLDDVTVERNRKKLQEWMEIRELTAEGSMECAGYDPPWTPGALRRNELLVRVSAPDQIQSYPEMP